MSAPNPTHPQATIQRRKAVSRDDESETRKSINQRWEALESAERLEEIDDCVSGEHSAGNTSDDVPNDNSPADISQEQLSHINQRWEQFYHNKQNWLRRYCYGDEDLMSIGLLSVRKRLAEHPDCPESWLVYRANLDIATARAPVDRVYLFFDKDQHYDEGWVNDDLEYDAMTPLQRDPELVFIDRVGYQKMLDTLGGMERKLLEILCQEQIMDIRHRWYGGQYSHTQADRPRPKKRFKEEVSKSETDWYVCFANVRHQFYMHFGTDEEIEREKQWYASFDPSKGGLHRNRDGRYDKS